MEPNQRLNGAVVSSALVLVAVLLALGAAPVVGGETSDPGHNNIVLNSGSDDREASFELDNDTNASSTGVKANSLGHEFEVTLYYYETGERVGPGYEVNGAQSSGLAGTGYTDSDGTATIPYTDANSSLTITVRDWDDRDVGRHRWMDPGFSNPSSMGIRGLPPDEGVPDVDNPAHVFYSHRRHNDDPGEGWENATEIAGDNINETGYNPDGGTVASQVEAIAGSGRENPGVFGNRTDIGYLTAGREVFLDNYDGFQEGLVHLELEGFDLPNYRINQLLGHRFDPFVSRQFAPYDHFGSFEIPQSREEADHPDPTNQHGDEGIIQNAHLTVVGFSKGAYPMWTWWSGDGPPGPENLENAGTPVIANEGHMLTELDFRIAEDEVGEQQRGEPYESRIGDFQAQNRTYAEVTGSSAERAAYYDGYSNGERTYFYHPDIRNRGHTASKSTNGEHVAFTGYPLAYNLNEAIDNDIMPDAATGSAMGVKGEAEVEIEVHEENRTRERLTESRTLSDTERVTTDVSVDTTVERRVFTQEPLPHTVENVEFSSDSCSGSTDVTVEASQTFNPLTEEREVTVTENVTESVSAGGSCSSEHDITIYDQQQNGELFERTASGTVRANERVTINEDVEIEFWNYWDPENETDTGGWTRFADSKIETREDSVELEDERDVVAHQQNADNFKVSQTAVEIQPGRYHVEIEIDQPDAIDGSVSDQQDFDEAIESQMFYWSMIDFGGNVTLNTDRRTLSSARFTQVEHEGGNRRFAGEPIDPLGLYMVNTGELPSITGSVQHDDADLTDPELAGWEAVEVLGDNDQIQIQPDDVFEDNEGVIQIDNRNMAHYNRFHVRDVPNPAQELVSIFGETQPIAQDEADSPQGVSADSAETQTENTEIGETELIEYRQPEMNITRITDDQVRIQLTNEEGEPMAGETIWISTGSTAQGEAAQRETDGDGTVTLDIPSSRPGLSVEYRGQTFSEVVDRDEDYFYGPAVAHHSTAEFETVARLFNLINAFLLTLPMFLLFLLWRTFEPAA